MLKKRKKEGGVDLSSSVLVKREQRECKTLSELKTDKLKNDSQWINLIKDTYCLPSRGGKKKYTNNSKNGFTRMPRLHPI